MSNQDIDVVVVGAGFAGLYQLYRLRQLGFSVRVFEAGAGLGGIWHWNCYPGARVDTHVPMYEFGIKEIWSGWNWSERFPGWAELREYFDYVDRKLDLRRDIQFNARVNTARFDSAENRWDVTTEDGSAVRCKFMVVCVGYGSKTVVPAIPGLEDFQGPCHHTGKWPQNGLDMKNKRVAVIGTGASGVQVSQEAAKVASHLTVFQRTPCLALPMQQRKLDAETQAKWKLQYAERFAKRSGTFAGFDFSLLPESALAASDAERQATYQALWDEGGFYYWIGTYMDVLRDEAANRTAYDFWRDKTRARIKDPVARDLLAPMAPPHPFGAKRPSLEQGYFEIFDQPHVRLVDLNSNPIEKVTSTGIQTRDGHTDFDIIVLATGFDAGTGGIVDLGIVDVDGKTMKQRWAQGLRTYLGVATSGFPNLLMVYGPQSPSGFCNGPSCAELQGDWIAQMLHDLKERNVGRVEAMPEAESVWGELAQSIGDLTLFPRANSWYMGANVPGKKRELVNYPGGLDLYLRQSYAVSDRGYEGFILDSVPINPQSKDGKAAFVVKQIADDAMASPDGSGAQYSDSGQRASTRA